MKMKVVFIVRSTFDSVRGGDTLQVLCTARELRKLDVEVDIKKASEAIRYGDYDLMHLFNLIRPADHLVHIARAGIPYVLSTIYLDYSRFDTMGRGWLPNFIFRSTGKHHAEYLKTCYRMMKRQDKIMSLAYFAGHQRAVRKVLAGARLLLPNSQSEYNRLMADFGIQKDFMVIPNGIDTGLFRFFPDVQRDENQVLCVGQIYGLKNQHRLIEATRDMGVKLVIIGKPPPNHHAYFDYCKKIAHRNVAFHGFMPQEQLVQFYARSKVHALPSWFETTGLSSLEAGAMACNLVVGTGGDTRAYFDGHASFCDAQDLACIRKALETELHKPNTHGFRNYILSHFTWEHAARETYAAYLKALDHER
ncbi:MAG: glycosyltransferase family 4 protein [Bacteroidetes bacterium]|nr:glycosyltransferase family 4 protein [Bacteroidota bacterium]